MELRPNPRYLVRYVARWGWMLIDTQAAAVEPDASAGTYGFSDNDRDRAYEDAADKNTAYYREIAPQLPNPQYVEDHAGWGVQAEDGIWLSSGYGCCWEDAMTAAQAAYVYTARDGMTPQDACDKAAHMMAPDELGEYSDYSKERTGSRARTTEALRYYRAQSWGEQYDSVRAAQVQQATVSA